MTPRTYTLSKDMDIIFPIFDYLCGDITAHQLMDRLRHVPEFQPLKDLNSESFEQALIKILSDILKIPPEREKILDRYISLAKEVKSLADIGRLELTYTYKRMLDVFDPEYDQLQMVEETESLTEIPADAPSYGQAYEKWMNILTDEILCKGKPSEYYPEPDALVRKALNSGDIEDLFPTSQSSVSKIICDLSSLA